MMAPVAFTSILLAALAAMLLFYCAMVRGLEGAATGRFVGSAALVALLPAFVCTLLTRGFCIISCTLPTHRPPTTHSLPPHSTWASSTAC